MNFATKSVPSRFPQRFLPRAGTLLIILGLASCVHAPRWNPETVAPPASLDEAVTQAKQSVMEKQPDSEAQAAEAIPLSRDGAILTALNRNRSLAVERYAPQLSKSRIEDARAAFDPSLLATVSYGKSASAAGFSEEDDSGVSVSRSFQGDVQVSEFLPTGTEVYLSGGLSRSRSGSANWGYSGSWSVGVNQSLLEGAGVDVNLIDLRQAENNAAISRHELRGFVIDLVEQVEASYWQLVLAKETLEIRRFSLQLAREQLELTEDYIQVGKMAQDARVSAEAEVASRQADLVDAEADVKARTIDLIRLLNPERDDQWALTFQTIDSPVVEAVEVAPSVSVRLADQYRPELAQSRLNLANQDLEVIRTRNGLLPQLDAFASYGRNSSGDSFAGATRSWDDRERENYEVGLSFQVAPLNRSEKASHQRAQFEQQQAEASVANLEQLLETEVRSAAVEVQRQWDRIPATQKTVESRQEELRVEQARFKVGKSTNLDVLQVQENLIQAQLSEVTARVQYIQALTALYQAEGTLLERRGIGVNLEGESVK